METYYCIHGATNNGNGASSAEAATPGGVGAFNDAIACLDGSESGLAAAQTPYKIVFKTNHNSANITAALSANLILKTGVDSNNEIIYAFDDGTTWPGEGGVFTLDTTGYFIDWVTDINFAQIIARSRNCLCLSSSATNGHSFITDGGNCLISGVYFHEAYTGDNHWAQYQIYKQGGGNSKGFLNAIKIDLVEGVFTDYMTKFLCLNASVGSYRIDGLEAVVDTRLQAANGPVLLTSTASMLKNVSYYGDTPALGVTFETALKSEHKEVASNICYDPISSLSISQNLDLLRRKGASSAFDFLLDNDSVMTQWKQGANYPTLNALLPDGVTNWSILVDTSNLPTNSTVPYEIFKKAIYYNQPSGSKVATTEILIPNTFAAPANNEWFVTLGYQDTSGNLVIGTTCSDTDMSVSAANWSSLVHGGVTYLSYKMEVPLVNIQEGSIVLLSVYTTKKPNAANEYYFIDPEPSLV